MPTRDRMTRKLVSFDCTGFYEAVMECARNFGLKAADVAVETGIPDRTLSGLRSGKNQPVAAVVAALGAWAGVNPCDFLIDNRTEIKTGEVRRAERKAAHRAAAAIATAARKAKATVRQRDVA